ncbi:transcription-repair coupling factor [Candidatus Aerophobetes bacterium]|nr:transcription-repair coupling factor [Candidatus Aerophobetes bacterium]
MLKNKFNVFFGKQPGEKNLSLWVYGLTKEVAVFEVALLRKKGNFLLFITSTQDEAEDIQQDLNTFLPKDKNIYLFPLREKDKEGKRLVLLRQLNSKKDNILIVTSINALRQRIPSPSILDKSSFLLSNHQIISRDALLQQLVKKGYTFSPLVEEQGDYSYRGGIIDFYSFFYPHPIRIELFGERIESIREFDPLSQYSIKKRDEVILSSRDDKLLINEEEKPFLLSQILPSSTIIIFNEPKNIDNEIKNWKGTEIEEFNSLLKRPHLYLSTLFQKTSWMRPQRILSLSCSSIPSYQGHFELLAQDIKKWVAVGYKIVLLTSNQGQGERLKELFEEEGIKIPLLGNFSILKDFPSPVITLGDIREGFIIKETKQIFITDEDIFKRYKERRKRWTYPEEKKIKKWGELQKGDYVVHIDYGIGKFNGIKTLKVEEKKCDYFQINYKGSDRLYVPIDQLDRLHKYMGDSNSPPPIYSLEGGRWRQTKQGIKKAVQEIASSLLKLYSARKVVSGHSFSLDTSWQLKFEASFPYMETSDQLKSIQEIKRDMEDPHPMDRLLCGDAGYGKTEVALRASFKAVMDNKQVAILAPTTILVEQHYRTFTERMAAYPINIEMLSRFQTPLKQKEIIENLKKGKVDIVIGTHRLIQKDINFKDLGLIIIDEEQKFGVLHKKRLREFKKSVDVLTLSATPIPRSLYMSLMGIRPVSMMLTPPQERKNIGILVREYDDELIKEAIYKELERHGQVFYLYNRINNIYKIAEKIRTLIPEASIAISHGRMPTKQLEKVTRDFLEKKFDILVCTTIIESGIDMPNVNTLIVENAEQFGLAELYQLRGRVGRGKLKGYAYFLFNPAKVLTEEAKKRLEIISQFKEAGSGFHIAMQDLEMRGAGNLLGKEQHGHIVAVGFTLYSQLLSEEIKKLKGEKIHPSFPVNLNLGIEARIPSSYVPYEEQRFELYRTIGEIKNEEEILKFKERMRDCYGPLPEEVNNLVELLNIKIIVKSLGITSLRSDGSKIWANFSSFNPLTRDRREKIKKSLWPEVQPLPFDERNLIILKQGEGRELFISLRRVLQKLKNVVL